ncbi:hypothetical protein ACCAA_790014 [Candidatus Accumulibacter aalborgensis]|uniref:Uncharacterized protein n=1 Tax=Candidatus Accumulibacter aalborgensis TaxID=1860102 RepID=A0A1A8XYS8_9PROT|nr:hypothetical protein [Candidatus Accumulibacter aalborgensis]SBT09837.1 hypothetical protein ACCAA_790014 [Candidatus Accumulibacter aalborgensis]
MKNAPDRKKAIESALEPRPDSITPDTLKARLQAGEIIAALDYPEADRPLFWSAITLVLDDLPRVRQVWRTIAEQHVDGIRTRQRMFRICPRQRGVIDSTLAGWIVLAVTCAALLAGGLPV